MDGVERVLGQVPAVVVRLDLRVVDEDDVDDLEHGPVLAVVQRLGQREREAFAAGAGQVLLDGGPVLGPGELQGAHQRQFASWKRESAPAR